MSRHWRSAYPDAGSPGCYIFIAENGEIVYVGKASHGHTLGRRIHSYFQRTESPDRGAPIHNWVNPPR